MTGLLDFLSTFVWVTGCAYIGHRYWLPKQPAKVLVAAVRAVVSDSDVYTESPARSQLPSQGGAGRPVPSNGPPVPSTAPATTASP